MRENLRPLVSAVKPSGRPAKHARREILNALAYGLRAGCAWRLLPLDLPPWQTVVACTVTAAARRSVALRGRLIW
ncbi:transposase [Streptomyces sp. NPDC093250]|uniref:transposase n=1 Tax=Streptomyces sp. NPDC093250 TaxID=3366036 RepID=UPI0037F2F313